MILRGEGDVRGVRSEDVPTPIGEPAPTLGASGAIVAMRAFEGWWVRLHARRSRAGVRRAGRRRRGGVDGGRSWATRWSVGDPPAVSAFVINTVEKPRG